MPLEFSPLATSALERLIPDAAARARCVQTIERIETIILEAAGTMNLTSDREPALFRARHTEDAILSAEAIATHWSPAGPARAIDVGSGAGLPGLIWAAIWPLARITLLESRKRRAEFIGRVAREVGLTGVDAVCARAEELGHDQAHRGQYDLVAARAVAALPVLSELTLPFARKGGLFAAIKSAAGIETELAEAAAAIRKLGGDPAGMRQIAYTRADGKACVICCVTKEQATPAIYPRLPGVPANQPLSA